MKTDKKFEKTFSSRSKTPNFLKNPENENKRFSNNPGSNTFILFLIGIKNGENKSTGKDEKFIIKTTGTHILPSFKYIFYTWCYVPNVSNQMPNPLLPKRDAKPRHSQSQLIPGRVSTPGCARGGAFVLAAKEREETPRKEEGKKSGEKKVSTIVTIYQTIKTRKNHTYWAAPRSREHREGRRQSRPKFEARSTKYETNPKSKCSKSKTKAAWYDAFRSFSFWSLEFRSFEFVSNFDIRISDLRTLKRPFGKEISLLWNYHVILSTLFKGEFLLFPALRLHLWGGQCLLLADSFDFSFLSIITAVLSNGPDEQASSGPPQHYALLISTSFQINKLKEVFIDQLKEIVFTSEYRAVSGPGFISLKKYPGLLPCGFLFLATKEHEETRRKEGSKKDLRSVVNRWVSPGGGKIRIHLSLESSPLPLTCDQGAKSIDFWQLALRYYLCH
jgi:hypothetical protein